MDALFLLVYFRFVEKCRWKVCEKIIFILTSEQNVKNIFKEKELEEERNMQKMHFPNSDKLVTLYSLDVIISVGYRVKSKEGTKFRIWANKILKDYMLKGYAVNQRR